MTTRQGGPRRRALMRSLLATPLLAGPATAQPAWPARPIRLVIPFGAGGSVDVVGRMLAEKLEPIFGQPVIVDNRPGGATAIGATHAARSAPDGYTLFYGTPATLMVNPYLMRNLPYDPDKDFASVVSIMRAPNLLAIHPSLEVKDIPGLIALAKRRPGELIFVSGGIGTSNHLSGELLNSMADIRLTHVPYRTFATYSAELIAGRVHMCFGTISDMLQLTRNGPLLAVAVTSSRRSPVIPDVPTVAETLPGFEATPFNHISVPAATPREIILALNAGFNRALADPAVVGRMQATGLEPSSGTTPEETDATIRREAARWKALIEERGIKLE
jgi:tripartite-type tricarboxylate transporter receptor subunit TctC